MLSGGSLRCVDLLLAMCYSWCASTSCRQCLLGRQNRLGWLGADTQRQLPCLSDIAVLPHACRYFRFSASTLPFDVYVISMDGATDRLASFQRSYEASGAVGGPAAAGACCGCAMQRRRLLV